MIALAWPWALALLPLPLAVYWLLPPARPLDGRALRLPARLALAELAGAPQPPRRRLKLLLAAAAWGLLVLAAARPEELGEPAALPMSGRDLMLAIDVSGSMEQMDFALAGEPASRLAVVKEVARGFIDRRVQDRIGLILFGSQPYVQTPLTYDHVAVGQMLGEAVVGLAGRDTAIGDAIGLAVKRLREAPQQNRVLVLLTDGDNTAGRLLPLQAAGLAARAGVRIYSIGLGGQVGAAAAGGYQLRRNADDLNPTLLQAIAAATGGQSFTAADADELAQVYRALDRLEPNVRQLATYRPARALYPWPAAAALGLSLAAALLTLLGGGVAREIGEAGADALGAASRAGEGADAA